MAISAMQVKMARAALGWGVRELASSATLSPDTISRLEQGSADIGPKTWAALQKALEEVGIEFFPELNAVTRHANANDAAICSDPSMPLGVRRIYPR